jgi:hypothetical protein
MFMGPMQKNSSSRKKSKPLGRTQRDNIILGGDLNFTLWEREFWGHYPRRDPQEYFFKNWICKNWLVDLEPVKLSFTWSNGRKGKHFLWIND